MSNKQSKKGLPWLGLALIAMLCLLAIRLPATAQTPLHYTELEFTPPLSNILLSGLKSRESATD